MDRTWTLHWLQAAGTLAPWRGRIRAEIEAAFTAIGRITPPPRADIVIHQIAQWLSPEQGFGGTAPSRETILLGIDTAHPMLDAQLAGGLRRVMVRQAYLCLRHADPGYGTRLAEALVSEGLAAHFVQEVLGAAPKACTGPDDRALAEAVADAAPLLWEAKMDPLCWMRGDGLRMPAGRGERLAWHLLDRYLARVPDARPSGLIHVPAGTVIEQAWPALAARRPASVA